eukprot:COSAG02_NODE_15082_length_1206_cov_7.238314_1_plen_61_part_01
MFPVALKGGPVAGRAGGDRAGTRTARSTLAVRFVWEGGSDLYGRLAYQTTEAHADRRSRTG